MIRALIPGRNQLILFTFDIMGNTNCVADGGCPHRADIIIANNTKYDLHLDTSNSCGRECNHSGWIITDGKIVAGCEPPQVIKAHENGTFSVSGREGTAVAPKGKVFYWNSEENLKVILEWNACGWTSRSSSSASILINGIKPASSGSKWFGKEQTPWNQKLIGEADSDTWHFNLRPKEGQVAEGMNALNKVANMNIGIK